MGSAVAVGALPRASLGLAAFAASTAVAIAVAWLDRPPPGGVGAQAARVAAGSTAYLAGLVAVGCLELDASRRLRIMAIVVAVLLASPLPWLGKAYRWAAHHLRLVLTFVVSLVLWLLTALLPWVFQRLVRFDPVQAVARTSDGWIDRRGAPEVPSQMWFPDPALHRPRLGRRVHARMPVAAAVLLVLALLVVPGIVDRLQAPSDWERTAAGREMVATPEGRKAVRDGSLALDHFWFSQYEGNELPDVTSETLNIEGGRRATWRSARCTGRPLRVWAFGASGLFGPFLPDDATISSELAKEAARRGLYLDVASYAIPGDVAWTENRRFERLLTGKARPDAVLFYDGFNDLNVSTAVRDPQRTLDPDVLGPMDGNQMRVLTELGGLEPGSWRLLRVPDALSSGDMATVPEAAKAYRDADRTSRLLAASVDAPLFRFLQPHVATRAQLRSDEPAPGPGYVARVAEFRRLRPKGTVDLGGVLDDLDGPLYYDSVHTTARPNPTIAAAMLDEMAPTLRRLARERGVGTCR